MSAALKLPLPHLCNWDDYEQTESASEFRHEFVNGRTFAMSGGSWNHNRIAGSVFAELSQQLRGKPCETFIADLKLRIKLGQDEFGYYPDVMVVCDRRDEQKFHVTNPSVVFEVLSPSTERVDRREKLLAYQGVATLDAYVLIEQTHPAVTVYRRAAQWHPESLSGLDAVLSLPEIRVNLPLATVYERVDWIERP